ncbi:MAG: J domain-containing protein [Thermomicrobium sp.]|uniref:J domain-containing protein n=1 Tax=Thermomicrobium sp. TaxID=1969469 RepID=UPI001B06DC04|nr:J domain-containing protein [Thermomicrobium sp.]MBO9358721.1 J domain-containing protein [Thermomicrobium sp.]
MTEFLPAPLSVLDRVRLEVNYLEWGERVRSLRQRVTLLELEQQEVRALIQRRLGPLQRECDELRQEVELLEARLNRLLRVNQPLADEELDEEVLRLRRQRETWRQEEFRQEWQGSNGHLSERTTDDAGVGQRLRRLYRSLARLLHPDLALDQEERIQREQLMRLVNQAWERRDVEQLQRLFAVWNTDSASPVADGLEGLRRGVAQRQLEEVQLRRRLSELERSEVGQLARKGMAIVERYVHRQEELLRHELAGLRLRRRRLLRLIEERRRELSLRTGSHH